ncbi:unnamed protein product [Dimorphilus gyrociliatus]|uniref:Uncharacterized protein n=1 Tax=Dimorphilus gyrociliatus TaxID=2664684 RepID=A0A7I8VWG0_9ANNE|nr:unnamed protein product [Dimorphilus gyrociliatus]
MYFFISSFPIGVKKQKGKPPSARASVICAVCSKKFNNSSALAKHKLTHSNERKYVCKICSKAFKRQDHLNGHMLTHRSKKPFACKFKSCEKSYCDARSLRRHVENAHAQDVEKIVEARRIMNAAYSPITPTGPNSNVFWEGNFFDDPMTVECKECNRKFKNMAALNGHMRLHGGYQKKSDDLPDTKQNYEAEDILNDITNTSAEEDDDVFSLKQMAPLVVSTDKKRRTMSADADKFTAPQRPYVTKESIVQLLKQAGMEEILNKVGLEVDTAGADECLELPDVDVLENRNSKHHRQLNDACTEPKLFYKKESLEPPKVGLEKYQTDSCLELLDLPISEGQGFKVEPAKLLLDTFESEVKEEVSRVGKTKSCSSIEMLEDNPELRRPFNKIEFLQGDKNNHIETNVHNQSFSKLSNKQPHINITPCRSKQEKRFRNAELPKVKKKYIPEPLVIPPNLNTSFGFVSHLRSPKFDETSCTIPPYTPPPILSPARRGSGLFWTVKNQNCLLPLETDILPHINIGTNYQAQIPQLQIMKTTEIYPETSVWSVESANRLCDLELSNYEKIACSAAVPGTGTNKEYALHVLHAAKGDVKLAMMLLLTGDVKSEESVRKRINYDLPLDETEPWSRPEIESFSQAMVSHDKNFRKVSECVGTKNIRQCVQFYYLWKKVCANEYKKMKMVRKRRHQNENFLLRSTMDD